jgi:hypothetical protein
MVFVRQTSVPVLASSATMKHPLVPGLVQPDMPAMTLPCAASGPPVKV